MKRKSHMAAKVAPNGDVSALCFAKPKPIDMEHETWTLNIGFVTCRACKAAYRERVKAAA